MRNRIVPTAAIFIFMLSGSNLCADEVFFKNGDKVTGKIVRQDKQVVVIQSDAIGMISVKRDAVKEIITEETKAAKVKEERPKLWERKIQVGYNEARGNTENAQISMGMYANRKTDRNEFTVKADSFYSSADKKMDTQKWSGMIRYALSFWEKNWYNFYKLENDHDRFANIDYRVIPSSGLGYWFSDTPHWKAMAEGAIGLEYTYFRDDTKDDGAVFIGRVFLEKELFNKTKLSQDVSIYPSLSDAGDYRLHSETTLTNPISTNSSLRLSLIDDYNSKPSSDAKKNDIRMISSIVYAF
ncbi:MAG: DUF481 domain-containing protein [Candidatus Omnitrophica bacterium]|nr:DUF481 domain-containing protein [Candidatus Omnitrophota bacterium]